MIARVLAYASSIGCLLTVIYLILKSFALGTPILVGELFFPFVLLETVLYAFSMGYLIGDFWRRKNGN